MTFHSFLTLLVLVLSILLPISVSSADQGGTIRVTVEGVKAAQGGALIVALFDSDQSWPKHDAVVSRQVVKVTDTTMLIVFEKIETGQSYAIQVFHDSNRNNKLDFRWFPYPKPKEGVGVSNNNRRLGPPSYEKALFRTDQRRTDLTIKLGY